MNYSKQEQVIIKDGKEYLKVIREFKRERMHLVEEYSEEPTPASLTFNETKGKSLSQIERFNDYTLKREMILKRIEMFNKVIDDFTLKTFMLSTRERQIIQVYMDAKSYGEMILNLEESVYISESTYKRELPNICIHLSSYINFQNIPSLEEINQRFYQEFQAMRHY